MINLANKCVLVRTHEDIDGTAEKKRIHIPLKISRFRIY